MKLESKIINASEKNVSVYVFARTVRMQTRLVNVRLRSGIKNRCSGMGRCRNGDRAGFLATSASATTSRWAPFARESVATRRVATRRIGTRVA